MVSELVNETHVSVLISNIQINTSINQKKNVFINIAYVAWRLFVHLPLTVQVSMIVAYINVYSCIVITCNSRYDSIHIPCIIRCIDKGMLNISTLV